MALELFKSIFLILSIFSGGGILDNISILKLFVFLFHLISLCEENMAKTTRLTHFSFEESADFFLGILEAASALKTRGP